MVAGNWTKWTDTIFETIKAAEIKVGFEFTLEQMYLFEILLKKIYPNNNHIRDKIRQQLQILREYEYVEFIDDQGRYRRLR
jgi:type II restriction enzyme